MVCCPVTAEAAPHHGVQWSTTEIVQTVVETPTYLAIAKKLFSEEERADIVALVCGGPGMWRRDPRNGWIFERSGLHAKEWGRVAGRGLCISGATRDFRFFASRFFRRMRKRICRWQSATR